MTTRSDWKTEKEICALFPVSIAWLRKMRRPGADGPPYYKRDPNNAKSPLYYKVDEFESWFKRGRIDPSAA